MPVLRYLPLLYFFILSAVPGMGYSRSTILPELLQTAIPTTVNEYGLNVKEFGALGDGQHNDAPAFQKALDEAFRQKKTLHIPSGKYYFPSTSTVTVPSGVVMEGTGIDNCLIFTDSVTDTIYPALINIAGENIQLRGMSFSGGRPVAADQRSSLIGGRFCVINISFDTTPSKNVLIENCKISDAYGKGIMFQGKEIMIKSCIFLRLGRYNIDFKPIDGAISNFGRNECADISILNNTFNYIGTHAVSSFRINRLTIEGNHLSQISGIGLANHQCQNLKLNGNRIEYTGDNGIDVQRCQQTMIADNYFYSAGNKNAGDAGSAAAIFYGDDYAENTANNAIISNNFIRGEFSFKQGPLKGRSQSCGIYVIDAFHVKVLHNVISGVGDMERPKTLDGIEDGNGIMVVNSTRGTSRDILIDGNSVYQTKNYGLIVNGQTRDIKVINNTISNTGGHGIYFSAVATNLFGSINGNTVADGKNWWNKAVAADIFIEAKNGWLTQLNVSGNQLRNNARLSYQSLSDSVRTTHGIYFAGKGFAKFNNIIVADNQFSPHLTDEIGFSEEVSSYLAEVNKPFPVTGFRNNYSGTTDDQPQFVIPGLNQKQKPWIITESSAFQVPEYGNYSKGSVIKLIGDPTVFWTATNSGFAASRPWGKEKVVRTGETIYLGDSVWRCIKAGRTGGAAFSSASIKARVQDGTVIWEPMGPRVIFVKNK
jgi:hypothetical protein